MARSPAVALLLLSGLSAAYAISGVATAYGEPGEKDSTGKNSCGFGNIGHWEGAYAALGGSMSGHCGDCAEVCGARGCAVVKIIDSCASCSYGHIDLSSNILQATTGFRYDRKPVTWSFVSCDGGASSKSTGSGGSAPAEHAAPAAPYVPPPCPFQEGQLVRCPSTSDIFKIESAQRRFIAADVWASMGSPAYSDYDCTSISYCPLGAPIDGPPKCTLTEGAWVQEDAPSDTTYFFTQGQLRPVDYSFWASVGSPPPARIGNAALAPCPKGPPLTLPSPGTPSTLATATPAAAGAGACAIPEGSWVQKDAPSDDTFVVRDGKVHRVDYGYWDAAGKPATTRPGDAAIKSCPEGKAYVAAGAAVPATPAIVTVAPADTAAGCAIADGSWVQKDAPSDATFVMMGGKLHRVDYGYWDAAGKPATTRPGNAVLRACPVGGSLSLPASGAASPAPEQQPSRKLLRL